MSSGMVWTALSHSDRSRLVGQAAAQVRCGASQPLSVQDSQPLQRLGEVADAETAKQGALLKPWMHLMLMRRAQPHPQSHLGPMRPLGRVPHGGHFPGIKCFSNWFFTRLGHWLHFNYECHLLCQSHLVSQGFKLISNHVCLYGCHCCHVCLCASGSAQHQFGIFLVWSGAALAA
jgi:hypothetical protein